MANSQPASSLSASITNPSVSDRASQPTVQAAAGNTQPLKPTITHTTKPSATTTSGKAGRRPKFSVADDIILIREVAAARAHIAPNGQTKERFEIAASRANASRKLSCPVTWKSIQDRYKRLQQRFDKNDATEEAMSGVGGEFAELEELLSLMKEARDDKQKEAVEKRQVVRDREAEKERLGAVIRDQALNRRKTRESTEGSENVSGGEGDTTSPKKKLRRTEAFVADLESELSGFTNALVQGDEVRNNIEKEKLALERERFELEKSERDKDRQDRRMERETASQIELQKFKAMLDLLHHKGSAGGASE